MGEGCGKVRVALAVGIQVGLAIGDGVATVAVGVTVQLAVGVAGVLVGVAGVPLAVGVDVKVPVGGAGAFAGVSLRAFRRPGRPWPSSIRSSQSPLWCPPLTIARQLERLAHDSNCDSTGGAPCRRPPGVTVISGQVHCPYEPLRRQSGQQARVVLEDKRRVKSIDQAV